MPLGINYSINNLLIVIKTSVIVISLLKKSEETVKNIKFHIKLNFVYQKIFENVNQNMSTGTVSV
jgi:hypothetical protein